MMIISLIVMLFCAILFLIASIFGLWDHSVMTLIVWAYGFSGSTALVILAFRSRKVRQWLRMLALNSLGRRAKVLERRCRRLATRAYMADYPKNEAILRRYTRLSQRRTIINHRWQRSVYNASVDDEVYQDRHRS